MPGFSRLVGQASFNRNLILRCLFLSLGCWYGRAAHLGPDQAKCFQQNPSSCESISVSSGDVVGMGGLVENFWVYAARQPFE